MIAFVRVCFATMMVLWLAVAPTDRAWAADGVIDVNTADQAALESLPGIGETKALAIINHRQQHGPFQTVDQLDDVSGIGPATLEAIRNLVTVGGGGAPPATGGAPTPAPAPTPSAPPTAPAAGAVNINTATLDQLLTLPGIGETKAAAILADRVANGPFASCADLDRVTGIGPATVASIGSSCTTQ